MNSDPEANGGQEHVAGVSGSADQYAKWNFTIQGIEGSTGDLDVSAWWTTDGISLPGYPTEASPYGSVHYEITYEGGTATCQANQAQNGAQWNHLGTYEFRTNKEYTIKVTGEAGGQQLGKGFIADAVKISGNVKAEGGFDPSDSFLVGGKEWVIDKWKDMHVVVQNRDDEDPTDISSIVTAQIETNAENTVTATENWSETLVNGSTYLITGSDPSQPTSKRMCVGSGAADNMRWSALPKGAVVYPQRAVDDTSKLSLPISFLPTGRGNFSADRITIKICDAKDPNNEQWWRFVRVYRNTGRVVVARTVAELDD